MNNPILTDAALRLSEPIIDGPTTMSVRLTGRLFQSLHVQLAAAENGDPAGPFTLTRHLGTLSSEPTEHTLHLAVTPRELRRTR